VTWSGSIRAARRGQRRQYRRGEPPGLEHRVDGPDLPPGLAKGWAPAQGNPRHEYDHPADRAADGEPRPVLYAAPAHESPLLRRRLSVRPRAAADRRSATPKAGRRWSPPPTPLDAARGQVTSLRESDKSRQFSGLYPPEDRAARRHGPSPDTDREIGTSFDRVGRATKQAGFLGLLPSCCAISSTPVSPSTGEPPRHGSCSEFRSSEEPQAALISSTLGCLA
jgi:hypothetical protein